VGVLNGQFVKFLLKKFMQGKSNAHFARCSNKEYFARWIVSFWTVVYNLYESIVILLDCVLPKYLNAFKVSVGMNLKI
jgi:hypothetical protein